MGNKSSLRKFFRNTYFKITPFLPENPLVNIFNKHFGHLRSAQLHKPMDADGTELPWFTYPAIEYLSQLDFSDKTFFEWGSGNSSVFFSKRVKSITSIEANEEWYSIGLTRLSSNQNLILAAKDEYANRIKVSDKKYDVIIIDGIVREECAAFAPAYLNEGGMIIYDNSERDPLVCKSLRERGFIQIDFHGVGPVNFYSWTTSLFFKDFNFKPKENQPVVPRGGIK
ncbi:O-methyltransferase [Pedobacter nutrimenti]|uniref:Methyltransferase family protein n=1 Tax=Pedobacter nutrimenti TaxID=1241337 RepID=A0A318UL43_9SPHI|nr:SAM-dependent methyltransferase [Pedobacter nutrimenti]PYF77166.1 hypothetical protein B0O44_101646 [Pedobacter nutrimenti]